MKYHRRSAGFTLLELLIVIAIVGILSAMAIVNLTVGKRKAVNSQVLASMRAIAPLVSICRVDDGNVQNGQGSPTLCPVTPGNTNILEGGPLCDNDPSILWPEIDNNTTIICSLSAAGELLWTTSVVDTGDSVACGDNSGCALN